MSLPSQNPNRLPKGQQPSIRSFFQPKQPTYAAPPSGATSSSSRPPQPQKQPQPQQQASPAAPLMEAPSAPPLPLQQTTNGAPTSAPPKPTSQLPVALPIPTRHPNITISPILPSHTLALKRITARLLPVRYPDSFYAALADTTSSGRFSRVLLWTDDPSSSAPDPTPTVIGGLVCRPESTFHARPQSAQDLIPNALYIQSLVLNEPYRRLGLATALLDEVCRLAHKDDEFGCRTVCAHVWTPNTEGMEWYEARGFEKVQPVVDHYYGQLTPNDAWIVRREILAGVSGATRAGEGGVMQALRAQQNGKPGAAGFTNTSAPAPAPAPAPTPAAGPPPPATNGAAVKPPVRVPLGTSLSYQNARPDMEWNDLPAEMSRHLVVPASGFSSGASSRSSSVVRKKKDRAYPAAAFGN